MELSGPLEVPMRREGLWVTLVLETPHTGVEGVKRLRESAKTTCRFNLLVTKYTKKEIYFF